MARTDYSQILEAATQETILKNMKTKKLKTAVLTVPLTLFTKNGKVTGCISGYVDSEKLESKLKEVGMLK